MHQLELFDDNYFWVTSLTGKPLFREYPALIERGITVAEMIISGRWTKNEAGRYLDYDYDRDKEI